MKKFIDLSFTYYDNFPNYPILPKMKFKQIMKIGENGSPSNVTTIFMPSHGGTHFDAPSHQVERARTVDRVQLDRCVGNAVLLDFSNKYGSNNIVISLDEIKEYDSKILERDIVVLNTGCYNHPDEFEKFGHLSTKAAEWLVKKNISLLAVDTPSVDLGVPKGEKMPVHQVILGNDIPIIEGLANLDKLSESRFVFIGLPIKIKGADGGPCRVIAIEGLSI
jgi:arylformamidase